MKTKLVFLALTSTFILQPSALFAQGSLTPPGTPAPTMKTLDQIEPRTPISVLPCVTTNSGSYYATTNLTGAAGTNGITVVANDVTIDLRGFTLAGVPGSLAGVKVLGARTNLTIENGIIRNWGGDGVGVEGSLRGGRFSRLTVSTNGGAGLEAGMACLISECVAHANGLQGIKVVDGSVVVHCTSSYNQSHGFYGPYSLFRGCLAAYNTGSGFYVYNYSQIRQCSAVQNEADGIALGYGCHAVENSCQLNNGSGDAGYAGIRTFYSYGHIEGNFVRQVVGKGIFLNTNNDPSLSIGWTVVRNRTSGATNTAYIFPAGNDIGPIGTASASTSPWSNLRN